MWGPKEETSIFFWKPQFINSSFKTADFGQMKDHLPKKGNPYIFVPCFICGSSQALHHLLKPHILKKQVSHNHTWPGDQTERKGKWPFSSCHVNQINMCKSNVLFLKENSWKREKIPVGIAQSVKHWALDHEVVGLNLPADLEVTLGGHSSSSLTIPRCKIGTSPWPRQSQLTLRIKWKQAIVHPSWL